MRVRSVSLLVTVISLFIFHKSNAQNKKPRKGEFYFSWGYNKEWYTRSNIKVKEPELLNDYKFNSVVGHDNPGWNDHLLEKEITIPQYNYRLGYFFNREKGWAIEINFDHTKYIIEQNQDIHITGTLAGKPVDSTIHFSEQDGFHYYLNNGANFLLFNIVKRQQIFGTKRSHDVVFDVMGKAGIGPVIPHVDNVLFGNANYPDFQFGGWNIGVEGAIRSTFFRFVYLEFANKLDYASYSGLKTYKGKAKQAFLAYELILSLGLTFPAGKRVD